MKKTTVSKRKWLILPIETKARELYGKLLLACFAAERGWGVVVGGKQATRGEQNLLPKGTFIEKSIPPGNSSGVVNRALFFDNKVSAWDEEGLVYMNKENYFFRRINPETFRKIDFFFTWGRQQGDDIKHFLEVPEGKMINSGNPRFDLLRPEFRGIFETPAKELRQKYGKIILINTSFWLFNSGGQDVEGRIDSLKESGQIKDASQEDHWRRMATLQGKIFERILNLLPKLSEKFKDYTIIIRPHPSEDNDPWIEKARNLPNVKMVHERNANEWITAADVIVENNCTTSIEAFLLGKPAITYRPIKDEEVEMKLPNGLGFHVNSDEELISLIQKILEKKVTEPKNKESQIEFLKNYIANVDGKLACQTIMNAMDTLDLPLSGGDFPLKHKDAFGRFLRKTKRKHFGNEIDRYYRKKFPGIKLSEVEKILAEFQKVSGKFSDLRIVQTDDDGFCVYKP